MNNECIDDENEEDTDEISGVRWVILVQWSCPELPELLMGRADLVCEQTTPAEWVALVASTVLDAIEDLFLDAFETAGVEGASALLNSAGRLSVGVIGGTHSPVLPIVWLPRPMTYGGPLRSAAAAMHLDVGWQLGFDLQIEEAAAAIASRFDDAKALFEEKDVRVCAGCGKQPGAADVRTKQSGVVSMPLEAYLDSTGAAANADGKARLLLEQADVVVLKDYMTDRRNTVFGRKALKEKGSADRVAKLAVLEIQVDKDTQDVGKARSLVRDVKGSEEYQDVNWDGLSSTQHMFDWAGGPE
jgi:hypothetical protein